MKAPRNPKFYVEMVIATVLSLLASSLWTSWTTDFIKEHFENSHAAMLAFAIAITLMAILTLQLLFSSDDPPPGIHKSTMTTPHILYPSVIYERG